ncbi:hypothetical protein BTVI_19078 [Pitangus sulphuratus]|nr:hypothetical protein BTVI_19078 [Pitangus sulphuratus]
MLPPVCPTGSSNTSASRLFLSLRLSTPLDLGNSTVQELVLSKVREPPDAFTQLEATEVGAVAGLGAAAVPVTTEGPFTVGTAYPITAENEGPSALVTGTADTSTMAADAEIDETIFTRSPLSSTFPPGAEPDSFVTVTSEYGPKVPALMNVTKPLNSSQGIEGGLVAPTTATTAAAITAQHPAVTPEAEYEVIEATPDPTLDITPDVKEDIPETVTRGEEDIDLTTGNVPLPTTPPPADTWVPQPTAGSPMSVGVTVLPSQGLTTAMGAVEEVITLPASIQTGANGKSSSPSPSAEELLTTQQGGVVSGTEGTNPEPAEEMAPAAEESPLASESGDAGDATNGEFSTASSSHLPPESPVMSGTEGSPGEPSLLPGQAVLSPDALLAPSTGYGDGKEVPGVSTEASGSTLSPAASEAPVAPEETEDTATSLLGPEVPTDAQSHVNLPTLATVLSTGDMETVGLDNPSLQPEPWQTPTGEQPPLLPDALTDTPSVPGAAYPPPGAEANTLPAADGAVETPSSPDLTTAPEAPTSSSLGQSQQAGMPDGAPQEADGPGTGLSSDSDAPSPAPFVPDGLAWPTAGVQGQGAQGAEDMAQAAGPGDSSPYTDTQSDMSPSAPQPSASPANNGDLLAGGTGDLANAEQSPPSALGEGIGAGGAPALGEVSSPGSAPPSSAGMEPDLSGAEGPVDLPMVRPYHPLFQIHPTRVHLEEWAKLLELFSLPWVLGLGFLLLQKKEQVKWLRGLHCLGGLMRLLTKQVFPELVELTFTDNGQIIFPASDKGIFTYPNPPPGGFNGHEEVPMIAVFWDNADFSRGVGTTFYQEFSTLNTAKPPFVRDVEAKVRRYMRSSYSAAWTLKITWEKAPVYSSWTDTRKTITYQAVLTTDGFRSYILMLYQDRGMQWDYTRLAATNVLIGYTSGDGFYHNDDLSKRPPAAKYRPDQFRGYNTDLRGLWIYKLESRVGINYRLKCLAWTGQQQEPRTWSQGLPTCPCSLQQGQQDPRFKSSRGGKWTCWFLTLLIPELSLPIFPAGWLGSLLAGWAGRWAARVSMLHSASPNQHGAGVRCLYDSQNQLIEGRQERYWRSSRQASPYRDQELKLYDWCCNRAGSAHLCARYSEKRPKIGCDGYQSPGMDSLEEVERDSDEEIDEDDK